MEHYLDLKIEVIVPKLNHACIIGNRYLCEYSTTFSSFYDLLNLNVKPYISYNK